jgi:hypothetical protein
MNKISISIVTFNNQDIIAETVSRILKYLSKFSFTLYLIDNDSYDGTRDILESLSNDNIEIILNQENIGFGAAHNLILDKIESKYHVIMNPDIFVENNIFEQLIEYLEKNNDTALVCPLLKYPDDTVQYLSRREITFVDLFIRRFTPKLFLSRQHYHTMRDNDYSCSFEVEFASGSFMFLRSNIFKRINGFDERFFLYLEDADLTKRINKISKSVFYPQAQVIHLWRRHSYNNYKNLLIHIKSLYHYFKKWGFKFK